MAAQPGQAAQPVAVDGSRTAARAGLVGTALLDSRGAWEVVDRDLCELLGRSEPELLSRPASMVFALEDEPRERGRLDQLLAGSLPGYRSEARVLHADGSTICALLEAVAVHDGDAPPRCLLQLQDVTARKDLEAGGTGWAMSADDLDEGSALVAIKGLDGLHLRIGSQFERAFAVSDERLRGRSDEYLFPASVAAALREGDRAAVVAAPQAIEQMEAIPRASGDEPMCFARFALRGATGRPYAVCTLAVDPSERDALEAHLEHLLAREQAAQAEACEMRERLLAEEDSARAGSAKAREHVLAGMSSNAVVAALPGVPPAMAAKDKRGSKAKGRRAATQTAESLVALEDERAARAQAEADRDRVRGQMDALGEELVEERRSVAALQAELKTLRVSLTQFEQAIQAEHEAQTHAEAERDRMRKEVDARAGELERQREVATGLEAELSQMRERVAALEAKRERAGQAGVEEELRAERDRLREEIGARDGELESEREAGAAARAQVSQLQAQTAALRDEMRSEHDVRARAEELEDRLRVERQMRAQAEAERHHVREEIGAQNQELERERETAAALQQDLSALQGQLTGLEGQLQAERTARKQQAGFEHHLHAERERRAQMEAERSESADGERAARAQAEAERDRVREEVRAREEELAQIRERLAGSEEELRAEREALVAAYESVARLQTEVAQARARPAAGPASPRRTATAARRAASAARRRTG